MNEAHGAVASKVLGEATVQAVLEDLDQAPIGETLRATLAFLRKVTREHERSPRTTCARCSRSA